jgi:hypothetical protein
MITNPHPFFEFGWEELAVITVLKGVPAPLPVVPFVTAVAG